jgi:hypothetical protein
VVNTRKIDNVPLTFSTNFGGETVRGPVIIMPNAGSDALFGVKHIKNVKKIKLKIK